MNRWTWILRSLVFHRRTHLGAFAGAVAAAAVLVGALVVGDSVRHSLRKLAASRLGRVEFALRSNDQLFRAQLAEDLAKSTKRDSAAVLALPAVALRPDSSARANQVLVYGVDDAFWKMSPSGAGPSLPNADSVVLSRLLARHLKVGKGDPILIRVHKPSSLSKDAPISKVEDSSVAIRLTVTDLAEDTQFGRFGLAASQTAPWNAFVRRSILETRVKAESRGNLLLIGGPAGDRAGATSLESLGSALTDAWKLEDAALELRPVEGGASDLRTSSVFLRPGLDDRLIREFTNATPILTYFVNELRIGSRATPYSMVSSVDPAMVNLEIPTGEVVLHRWLADDLQAAPGQTLEIAYFAMGTGRKLEERRAAFKVRAILEVDHPAWDRALVPDFPGLTDAENCRDWDSGFPIQTDRIRPKDEEYWKTYRGTPKALISLADGQRLWNNRFGKATSIRFAKTSPRTLEAQLRRTLKPGELGLRFEPVALQAAKGVAESQDFAGLFIGFSFFLIASALMLTFLLFQFGVEQRRSEAGTLSALGFQSVEIRWLMVVEGVLLSAVAGVMGVGLGALYAKAMLQGLSTIWVDAVGTSQLGLYLYPPTLLAGWTGSVLVAGATLWVGLRRSGRVSVRAQLASEFSSQPADSPAGLKRGFRLALLRQQGWLTMGVIALGFAGILAAVGIAHRPTQSPGLFFGAGALSLMAGVCLSWSLILYRACPPKELLGSGSIFDPRQLIWRNLARKPLRSLAVISTLASAGFLVLSIGVFRLDSTSQASNPGSGTGGFALFGQTALPVVHDLGTIQGREFYNLPEKQLAGSHWVSFRVRDGDDASCLNLNRAQRPRVLGVNPAQLMNPVRFRFAAASQGSSISEGWRLLEGTGLPTDEVAAIGDAASVQWALGKSVGDSLDSVDELGRPFKLRIVATVANSLLQGSLIISESNFIHRFPTEAGYRWFLVSSTAGQSQALTESLTRGLLDQGAEWQPATERLNAFNAVQNTYLGTFQVLGGLGVVLGCAGLGAIILRNVMERRSELGLLGAVGFGRSELTGLIAREHLILFITGLAVALCAASVAVAPTFMDSRRESFPSSMWITLAAMVCNGLFWTSIAARASLRSTAAVALQDRTGTA